ncbi:MAG: NADH-quinone oxidoreductase subunit NuoH [Deltaproteobacteria bacterium]|nr:NADH-quinone oxidoreductase subunit NuoH [Deltaproteobacteria bacterium]
MAPYQPKSDPKWLVALTLAVALTVPFLFPVLILLSMPLAEPSGGGVTLALRWLGNVLGTDLSGPVAHDVGTAVVLLLIAFLFINFGAIFSGICVWWERRIAGRMQSRIGPNRQGLGGFLVWVADAVKFLLKEDLVPAEADSLLFRIAPYFVLTGFALTFVVLPFGHSVVMADLNVGVFYITSVTALVVVGILISGWSSNSKWALFGGMRSAAQVVSYEIPAGLAVFVPVLMAGSLSMQDIIRAQGAAPWDWFIFRNPAALVAFFVLFTSQLAEANRTPFDLPEAESELVAGYLSEYSGFRFALFFMSEFGNIWVMSALATTLFFGGWQVPGMPAAAISALKGTGAWWGWQLVSMAVFAVKTLLLANVVIWLRWTLPRIRIDQMMTLSWKYLVPIGFVCLIFTLFWQLGVGAAPGLELASGVALSVGALFVVIAFFRRVFKNVTDVRGDAIDLSNW